MAKKRKKGFSGKYTLFIGAILFLNLIGVSYGYWNDGLQVRNSVTTGKIEVIPRLNNSPEGVMIQDFNFTGGNNANIQGVALDEYEGELELKYLVTNTGTIPVRILSQDGREEILYKDEEVDFSLFISPGESVTDTLEIRQFNGY